MITQRQRLELHRRIMRCSDVDELRELARALLEREIQRQGPMPLTAVRRAP